MQIFLSKKDETVDNESRMQQKMGTFCSKKTQGKILRNLNSSLYIISRDQFSALKKDKYNSKKEFKQVKKLFIILMIWHF